VIAGTSSSKALHPPASKTPDYVRVLRWTYRRDDDTLVCEMSLTGDDSAYELRIQPPWSHVGTTTERFDDAMAAFQRQASVERILVAERWSLDRFDSDRLLRS
jgi:hypothetical protein